MLRTPSPPYSVPPASFRFPALATLAGKLPLGAGREAVIAALLAARLAADTVPPGLDGALRGKRATAARQWFPALCQDPRLRTACIAVADASAGDSAGVAPALARVIEITARHLDADARSELAKLARALGSA